MNHMPKTILLIVVVVCQALLSGCSLMDMENGEQGSGERGHSSSAGLAKGDAWGKTGEPNSNSAYADARHHQNAHANAGESRMDARRGAYSFQRGGYEMAFSLSVLFAAKYYTLCKRATVSLSRGDRTTADGAAFR